MKRMLVTAVFSVCSLLLTQPFSGVAGAQIHPLPLNIAGYPQIESFTPEKARHSGGQSSEGHSFPADVLLIEGDNLDKVTEVGLGESDIDFKLDVKVKTKTSIVTGDISAPTGAHYVFLKWPNGKVRSSKKIQLYSEGVGDVDISIMPKSGAPGSVALITVDGVNDAKSPTLTFYDVDRNGNVAGLKKNVSATFNKISSNTISVEMPNLTPGSYAIEVSLVNKFNERVVAGRERFAIEPQQPKCCGESGDSAKKTPKFPITVHKHDGSVDGKAFDMSTSVSIFENGYLQGRTEIWTKVILRGYHGGVAVALLGENNKVLWKSSWRKCGIGGAGTQDESRSYKIWTEQVPQAVLKEIRKVAIIHKYDPQSNFGSFLANNMPLILDVAIAIVILL